MIGSLSLRVGHSSSLVVGQRLAVLSVIASEGTSQYARITWDVVPSCELSFMLCLLASCLLGRRDLGESTSSWTRKRLPL
ncbi:hypothetical protein LINPERHAP1_LOCUS39708 [Linum perenne]